MIAIGKRVKMKNRSMLPDMFINDGKITKVHEKDDRIVWASFPMKYDDQLFYTLNLHETELEVLDG